MANIYTKTGDEGKTSLYGGTRVSKDSKRVECYGTVDELNSMIGLASTHTTSDEIYSKLKKIQADLFLLGAEIASDENGRKKLKDRISENNISELESWIDKCTEINGNQVAFVVPGKNTVSAVLHVARTIARRGERLLISLSNDEDIRIELRKYLNRISDTLYAFARLEETNMLIEQVTKEVITNMENKNELPKLDLEVSIKMAEYAFEKSRELNVPITFSVVDSGGNLILFNRMENALLVSTDISINKAYTSNAVKLPTHEIAKLVQPGEVLYGLQDTNSNKIVIFGGGFPYKVNNEVLGGIGVSGGSVDEDMEIALYALNKLREFNR